MRFILLVRSIRCTLPSTLSAQPRDIPISTPSGIMLVEVHQEEGFSSDQYFWTRLGDASGSTLFYSDAPKEISTEDFTPLEGSKDPLILMIGR